MKIFRECIECGRRLTTKASDKCEICRSKARWERRKKAVAYYEHIKPAKCVKCGREYYPIKTQFCTKCLKKEKFLKKFMGDK